MTTFDWRSAALDAENRWAETMRRENALKEVSKKIIDAVMIEGKSPKYHRHIMFRHRNEWKVLWKAIDDLIAVYGENYDKN